MKHVFLLGAGFSRSVALRREQHRVPLATNFLQILTTNHYFDDHVDYMRHGSLAFDDLLADIERYWHMSLEDLKTQPFDIEECLTFFESQRADLDTAKDLPRIERAEYTVKALILILLTSMPVGGGTPAAGEFAQEVLASHGDVITLNYDNFAEMAIAGRSGFNDARPSPPSQNPALPPQPASPDYLYTSYYKWDRVLALGFKFDEIATSFVPYQTSVSGSDYYNHPGNELYGDRRVLKLHGSIDWLAPVWPAFTFDRRNRPEAPSLLALANYVHASWRGELPQYRDWYAEPRIIPPHLNKQYDRHPFPELWRLARETLGDCTSLTVVGYSFPPTDFRVKRLLRESFAAGHLEELTVVNPDPSSARTVRELTGFRGRMTVCSDLADYYGVERW